MTAIVSVTGREILDSRGNPTVEVDVLLESGAFGRPAGGARRAPRPACTRPSSCATATPIATAARACCRPSATSTRRSRPRSPAWTRPTSAWSTRALVELDGTDNKGNLGANAILGASLATAKAAADDAGLALYRYVGGAGAHVLPVPMMNVMNGGVHADNSVDMQEFMVVPVGADVVRRGRCGSAPRPTTP